MPLQNGKLCDFNDSFSKCSKVPVTIKMLRTIWGFILRAVFIILCFFVDVFLTVKYWGKRKYIPAIDNPLLLKSATTLAKEIREREIKSEDVVHAYIDRILAIDTFLNATVERCFQEAIEKAKEVDNLLAYGKYTKEQLAEEKPFLGVPLSVKLLLKVKGLNCSAGSVFLKDDVASEDSPSVALMKKAGAIVIATTNTPEMGMNFETYNFLYGRTCNPYDTTRTSGGSSGGESALISGAGSVMGLGNDLGGSIRAPCHFTGIFGHKPTAGIVPNGGCVPETPFFSDYIYTGPMCRYAEDLVSTMKILTSECKIPLNIGKPVDFKRLKIYYMVQVKSPFVSTVDLEIEQGLKDATSYFQASYGSKVEKIELKVMSQAPQCVLHNINAKLSEVCDLKSALTQGRAAHVNDKLDLLKWFFGKSEFTLGSLMIFNFIRSPLLYNEKNIPYYQELLEKLYNKFDTLLDDDAVFLFPTFPKTAPHHHGIQPLVTSSCYTSLFNCLGLPSTQCPLSLNKQGMPYGIQIIGRKNNDALTIACAVELEKRFGGWVPPKSK